MSEPFDKMMQRLHNLELLVGSIKRDSWTFLHVLLAIIAFASIRTCAVLEEMNLRSKPKAVEPEPAMEPKP